MSKKHPNPSSANQVAFRRAIRVSGSWSMRVLQGKTRAQSIVIIALSMLALIAIIGLAIDGGSMYGQRRKAQNGADGAALAATRLMLDQYEQMLLANLQDVDGTAAQEQALKSTIMTYAAAHDIVASTVQAYFVNDNRQVVSVPVHPMPGGLPCGTGGGMSPCQVGQNGAIPWTISVRGITVTGRAQTGAFFMKTLGYDTVGASATGTALMGVGVSVSNIAVMPLGLYTDTANIENMVPGQLYTLLDSSTSQGPGNLGWIDWNAESSSANATAALIECGFNPSNRTQAQWDAFCPSQAGQGHVLGPTAYWTGWPAPDAGGGPLVGVQNSYFIQYGPGEIGWWLQASSGVTLSNCEDLATRVNGGNGEVFVLPIIDYEYNTGGGGSNVYYHLRTILLFRLHNSAINCHEHLPTGGTIQHWHIEGYYIQRYSTNTSGQVGDLRHNSNHIVFLAP
jgi:hypothetical protein